MRQILWGGVACSALSAFSAFLAFGVTAAAAADLRPRGMPTKAPVFSPEPVHNWQGLYIGGHVGGIGGVFNNNVPLFPGPVDEAGSIMGGVQVGYNWQVNRLVFGIEADTSAIEVRAATAPFSFEENWQTTVRGRLGYAWQRALLYVTAGVGFTNVDVATIAGTTSKVQAGLAVGAGIEMALPWPRWSGRIEYLYVEVPKDSYFTGPVRMDGGSGNHIGRVAVNYWLW